MLKTTSFASLAVVSSWLFSSVLGAADVRYATFDELRSVGLDVSVEVELDEPMVLDGHTSLFVEHVRGGVSGPQGRATLVAGIELIEDGEVVGGFPPEGGVLNGRNGSVPLRAGIPLNENIAEIHSIRFTLGIRNADPADGMLETWLRPFDDTGLVRLVFVRGNLPFQEEGQNEMRDIGIGTMSLNLEGRDDMGETPWDYYWFESLGIEPVDGRELSYCMIPPMGYSSRNACAAVVTEFGVSKDDAISWMRLDDCRSPSIGQPVHGDLSTAGGRLFSEAEREQLDGAHIIAVRMKLVAIPGSVIDVRPNPANPLRFFFFRDEELVPEIVFQRGDSNSDGNADLSDGIFILGYLFLGGDTPGCLQSSDNSGDGNVDIADAIYLFTHLFLGGDSPAAPYPGCGVSALETDAQLGCEFPPDICI